MIRICGTPRPKLKGATTGDRGGPDPPPPKQKNWTDHPNFFDEECDYRYITHCSARNWVYHPYFVMYNNLDQGIGPPTLKSWLHPFPNSMFMPALPICCVIAYEKYRAPDGARDFTDDELTEQSAVF